MRVAFKYPGVTRADPYVGFTVRSERRNVGVWVGGITGVVVAGTCGTMGATGSVVDSDK